MRTALEMEAEVRRLMQADKLHDAATACDQLNQQHPDFKQGWIVASGLALRVNEPIIAVRAIELKKEIELESLVIDAKSRELSNLQKELEILLSILYILIIIINLIIIVVIDNDHIEVEDIGVEVDIDNLIIPV